jgi:hypothetical protein
VAARVPKPLLLSPTAYLRRAALYRGLLGGDRKWLGVGAMVWGPRLLRRAFGKHPTFVASEVMRVGDVIRLESLPPQSRKQRKRG